MKLLNIIVLTLLSINTLVGQQEDHKGSNEMFVDLIHNEINLSFNQEERTIIGQVALTFKPHFYEQKYIILDAKDSTSFVINKVVLEASGKTKSLIDNTDYHFVDLNHLIVNFNNKFTANDTLKLFIDYISRPYLRDLPQGVSDRGCFFINHDGNLNNVPQQIWTQGETEHNSNWMPIVDSPNQRYTQKLSLTVDNKFTTQSNGDLISSKANSNGTRTDIWRLDKAHTPYLSAFVVGEYAVITDQYKDIELRFLVEKEFENEASNIFGKTKEMFAFFEDYFGIPYPWGESYGQVIIRGFGSTGMENSGCVTYDDRVQITAMESLDRDFGFEYVIAHELAHMWFGNLLTCESWSQLGLNESFATLSEFLWFEHKYGKLEADRYYFDVLRKHYLDDRDVHDFSIIRNNYTTPDDMFTSLVYEKGANVLRMLQHYLGEAFKEGIRRYLKDNQFSSVEIDELRMAFEDVSGKDLKEFFELFSQVGHPSAELNFSFEKNKVIIDIDSIKNMPKGGFNGSLRVYFKDGKVIDENIKFSNNTTQTFIYQNRVPINATFEPEGILLGDFKEIKSTFAWLAQLNQATFFNSKIRAIRSLSNKIENPLVIEAFKKLLEDDYWAYRLEAARTLLSNPYLLNAKVIELIFETAIKDKKAQVRWEILDSLKNKAKLGWVGIHGKSSELIFLCKELTNDNSFKVQAMAIQLLNEISPSDALNISKSKINSNSIVILQTVASTLMKNDKKGNNLKKVISVLSNIRERRLELNHLSEFAEYLNKLEDKKAGIDYLVSQAENGIYSKTRSTALEVLNEFKKDEKVIGLAIRMLRDKSYSEHKEQLHELLSSKKEDKREKN